jgi:hypothetical protein
MPYSATVSAIFLLRIEDPESWLILRYLRFREDDLIPLHACYFPAGDFGAEGAEPVRSLLTPAHRFLALPKSHYQYLAVLVVGKDQQSLETVKPLECPQDLLLPDAREFVQLFAATFNSKVFIRANTLLPPLVLFPIESLPLVIRYSEVLIL